MALIKPGSNAFNKIQSKTIDKDETEKQTNRKKQTMRQHFLDTQYPGPKGIENSVVLRGLKPVEGLGVVHMLQTKEKVAHKWFK